MKDDNVSKPIPVSAFIMSFDFSWLTLSCFSALKFPSVRIRIPRPHMDIGYRTRRSSTQSVSKRHHTGRSSVVNWNVILSDILFAPSITVDKQQNVGEFFLLLRFPYGIRHHSNKQTRSSSKLFQLCRLRFILPSFRAELTFPSGRRRRVGTACQAFPMASFGCGEILLKLAGEGGITKLTIREVAARNKKNEKKKRPKQVTSHFRQGR